MAGVVVAGAGTLAGYAARWGWLVELCCHFRVQYFWALTTCAVALAIGNRRRWAFVAAALAGINLASIVPLYFGPKPGILADSPSRAMLLNVRWLNQEYDRTIELIRAEQPDFVLLVEVTPEWADALEALRDEYPYGKTLPRRSSLGLALLSRIECDRIEVRRLPVTRLPLLVATMKLPSGRLTLLGTHPPSPVSAVNFDNRNQQLAEVADVASQIDGARMLLGDLNTTGWSPYFQDLLDRSGLADSRRGFGVEASWPNLPQLLRIPIDHCLVSPHVVVFERRISRSVGSDHRAVIVDFGIAGP